LEELLVDVAKLVGANGAGAQKERREGAQDTHPGKDTPSIVRSLASARRSHSLGCASLEVALSLASAPSRLRLAPVHDAALARGRLAARAAIRLVAVHPGGADRRAAPRAPLAVAPAHLEEIAQLLVERGLARGDRRPRLAEDLYDRVVERVELLVRQRLHERLGVDARREQDLVGIGVPHRVKRR